MALVASVWRSSLLLSTRVPSQLPHIRPKVVAVKKQDFTTKSKQQQPIGFPPKLTNSLLARSAVAIFALGFIDAGSFSQQQGFLSYILLDVIYRYSGDWSKIGVISKDAEELLKVAAFLVVPSCIFVIHSLSNRKNESN